MKKAKISFFSHPFRWIYMYCIWMHLPLMWKSDLAIKHIKWMTYKRHLKDELFGKYEVQVIEVLRDWDEIVLENGTYRYRDIKYRMVRSKLKFWPGPIKVGTQATDETAHPFKLQTDYLVIAKILDKGAARFKRVADQCKTRQQFFDKSHVYKGE